MTDSSEYCVRPKAFLVFNPIKSSSLPHMTKELAKKENFLEIPAFDKLCKEYKGLIDSINKSGIKTIDLDSIVDLNAQDLRNPNLMFTRDSSVTLPWAKDVFLPANLKLEGRSQESKLVSTALTKLGLKPIIHFSEEEFLEGGDVIPVQIGDSRTLLIGIGSRTNLDAVRKIRDRLIPEFLDLIIALEHPKNILHLDTGLNILPDKTILTCKGMFREGLMIDKLRETRIVNPISYLRNFNYTVIETSVANAVNNEVCNILPLGDRKYIGFNMDENLKNNIEISSNSTILTIEGEELAKATGGVHCLTRPIY